MAVHCLQLKVRGGRALEKTYSTGWQFSLCGDEAECGSEDCESRKVHCWGFEPFGRVRVVSQAIDRDNRLEDRIWSESNVDGKGGGVTV